MLIRLASIIGLMATVANTHGWPEPWPSHWHEPNSDVFPGQQIPLAADDNDTRAGCRVSNMTAFEMAKGRKIVDFTTKAMGSLEEPKIPLLNSSTGEQWEFDGVSDDGMQSFVFGFYRDANYAILGTGNFRLSIEFGFADRTRFYEVYYPQRSVVETCPHGTRGLWIDEKTGHQFSFQVNADLTEAIVTLDSDTLKGKVYIHSRALPLTADGNVWPAENASTAPIPYWHWSQPIPAGTVETDVEIKGKPIKWTGMGGHERFWSAFSWFTCLRKLQAVRAMLGPYVLSYLSFTSEINSEHSHQSVVLFKDGAPVFRSTGNTPSDMEDYALVTKTYGGAVTGTLKDKVTGFQLELVSPSNMHHYTFFVEHLNLGFEYILGEGVGGSGFSARSRGGHVGLGQYEGVALTEALTFPRNSPLFKSNYAIRILGTTVYGGADVAEVLEAVGEIKPGDPVSWERAWRTQALRAEELADEAHRHGDRDAARRGYLRAANYTRASGYMYVSTSAGNGESLAQDACSIAEKVRTLFRKALPLMDGQVHRLSIPYDEYHLPGYLYLPPVDRKIKGRKTPILVNCGGADSCQEELYFLNPAAGPGMGYAVLTFDGPGQGLMLKQYEVTMRPDWETVVAQVIDYLVKFSSQHPELDLDLDSIAVSGASMGGYFALRAAAEPRVKACVSIDPFYDMWDFGTAHVSPIFISAWTKGWIGHGFVDRMIGWLSAVSFQLKWEISVTSTLFGLSSPAGILQHMKKYTFASGSKDGTTFLSRVTCPVLVSGAGKSLYMDVDNHTRRCFEALTNVPPQNKEIWVPESEGQGSLQAKMGALALCNQRTYQFLDKAFGIIRDPLL